MPAGLLLTESQEDGVSHILSLSGDLFCCLRQKLTSQQLTCKGQA